MEVLPDGGGGGGGAAGGCFLEGVTPEDWEISGWLNVTD